MLSDPTVLSAGGGGPGPQRQAYLELHGACLGDVKGVEEVMGVHAGICKAQKERQVMGAKASQRTLGNNKKEKRVLLGKEEVGVGKTPRGKRDSGGCPGV